MKIGEYEQMMAYLTRPGLKDGTPPIPKPKPFTLEQFQKKADLYIKGALGGFDKREMINLLQKQLDKVEESESINKQEALKFIKERTQQLKDFIKENPGETLPGLGRENFQDGTPGKSAFRKPFPPEIEKQIIKLHQVDKMGAQAIADELGLSRSPVGKRITALKKEGKIKDIPYAERKASIDQRGDLFGKAPGEKYLTVREIRDVDRKAVDKSTGKSLYNIPEKAKFKVNFGNTGARFADITNIPEEFIGVKYFNTKEAAEKALAKRKKLKLIGDEDPDPIRRKANKKKYDLVKEVSDNNIERILADFKKGQPLEQAHRLSLNQVKKTGEMYNVMNLGLDFDDPKLVQINNELVKPYENKLKQLYTEQNKLYKKASNLKTIPKELQKQIEFNNLKISSVVDLAGGRVQGLQLDEVTLKPKVTGVNYANVLGFGIYDKPVKELKDVDRAGIGAVMQGQIENEKRTAGKTAEKLFQNKQFLKDVDKLAVQSMVPGMTTADKIPTPDKTKTRDMFKNFEIRTNELGSNLGLLRGVGETLKAIPTPTGTLALTAGFGVDPTSAIDRATLGLEAALAPDLVKQTSRLTSNPIVQKFFNLGLSPANAMRVARVAQPLGLLSLAGEGLYQLGKRGAAEKAKLDAMTPFQKQQYLTGEIEPLMDEGGMVDISREGFADGPDDPSKRKFVKIMGGLASLPVIGKFIKIAEPLAPAVSKAIDEIPDFITDLIKKVKTKAEATGMKFFTGNRSDEFADVYKADGYTVTEQGNKVTIGKRKESGEMIEKDMEMEIETDPETGGLIYREATARPDAEGKLKDVEEYIDEIDLEDMKKYTYDD